nr:hypothetical protein [Citrobacter rodentium]
MCRDGGTAWQAEYDEWGNVLREDNPGRAGAAHPPAGAAVR